MRDVEKQLLGHAEIGDLDGPNGVISVLKTGVNVDIQDEHGRTALMWAAMNGHTEITDILIQADVDINIQDKNGKTALMWGADLGYIETTNILIQNGADMFIKDRNGKTALDIAIEKGHTQIAELIKQRMKMMEQERSMGNTSIYNMSRWL